MMRVAICSVAFLALAAGQTHADIITYAFALEGSQEVPPTGSPATGSCTVTLDDTAQTVDVACTFSGLQGNANNSHIHGPAQVGQNAGVVVPLSFSAATSGTISTTGAALTAQQVLDMKAGLHYVNLHSTAHTGGEIRGQIVNQVPTISEWGLIVLTVLIVGAGAVVLRRRAMLA